MTDFYVKCFNYIHKLLPKRDEKATCAQERETTFDKADKSKLTLPHHSPSSRSLNYWEYPKTITDLRYLDVTE